MTEKNYFMSEHQFLLLCVLMYPYSGCSNFSSAWDEGLSVLWISAAFSVPANMLQNDLVQPVAAAAATQVKLCPYDEEEPHICMRILLITI
jgi:hypothetical protein